MREGGGDKIMLTRGEYKALEVLFLLMEEGGGAAPEMRALGETLDARNDAAATSCSALYGRLERLGLCEKRIGEVRGNHTFKVVVPLCSREILDRVIIVRFHPPADGRGSRCVDVTPKSGRMSREEAKKLYAGRRYEDHNFKKEPEFLNPYVPGRGGRDAYAGGCALGWEEMSDV